MEFNLEEINWVAVILALLTGVMMYAMMRFSMPQLVFWRLVALFIGPVVSYFFYAWKFQE